MTKKRKLKKTEVRRKCQKKKQTKIIIIIIIIIIITTKQINYPRLISRGFLLLCPGASLETTDTAAEPTAEGDEWGLQASRVIGLRVEAFPEREAWESLLAFFRDHEPVSQEVGNKTLLVIQIDKMRPSNPSAAQTYATAFHKGGCVNPGNGKNHLNF